MQVERHVGSFPQAGGQTAGTWRGRLSSRHFRAVQRATSGTTRILTKDAERESVTPTDPTGTSQEIPGAQQAEHPLGEPPDEPRRRRSLRDAWLCLLKLSVVNKGTVLDKEHLRGRWAEVTYGPRFKQIC